MKAFQKWPFFHPRDAPSDLYRWLKTRNFLHTLERPPNPSHTMFNGGSLTIPDEQADNFVGMLAKDIATGKQWCIAEMVTAEAFAMYMDFDFHSLAAYHNLDEILKTYHEVLRQYYPELHDEESQLVTNVCIRPATAEHPERVGVHLVTPTLIVDTRRANLFARHVQFLLTQRLPGHPWSDIVDKAVYNSGLRMCYNLKTKPCAACAPERKRIQPLRKKHKVTEKKMERQLQVWKEQYPSDRVMSIADCIANFPGVTGIEQLQQHGARITLASQIYPNAQFWKAIHTIMKAQVPKPPEYPTCGECGGVGRFYIPQFYDLDSVFATELRENSSQRMARARSSVPTAQEIEEVLVNTRIRRQRGTPLTEPYRIPNTLPVTVEDTRPATASSSSNTSGGGNGSGSGGEFGNITNISSDHRIVSVVNDPDDQRIMEVAQILQKMRPEYDGLMVNSLMIGSLKTTEKQQLRKIDNDERRMHSEVAKHAVYSRLPNGLMSFYKDSDVLQVDRVWVRVSGAGAHFCHNKGAAHGQNRVYFEIASSGECYQRCHSTKRPEQHAGRNGVPCNKYRFKLGMIPPNVQKLLFPTIRTDTYHPLYTQQHMIDDMSLFQQRIQADILSVTWRYYDHALERFVQTGLMDFKTEKDKENRGGQRQGQGQGQGRGRRRNADFGEEEDIARDPEEQFIRQNRKRNVTALVSTNASANTGEVRSIMDLMPALADGTGMTTTKRKKQRNTQRY